MIVDRFHGIFIFSGQFCDLPEREILIEFQNQDLAVFPVSYTHLDVYKRQGLTREKTRFVAQPRISTGAGDHFNGASCFALLAGLCDRDRVHFAGVFASTYVSKGSTPTLDEVLDAL